MDKSLPPHTIDVSEHCPKPDLVAIHKDHFGNSSWEFECDAVEEIALDSKGIVIQCSIVKKTCCIDDGVHHFVNSPKISPLKSFFEVTMKYFDK